jgi:stage II sporulation protein D
MKRYILSLALSIVLCGCVTLSTENPQLTLHSPEDKLTPAETSNPIRIRVAIVVRKASIHLTAPESFLLSGFPLPVATEAPVAEGVKKYRAMTLTPSQLLSRKAYLEPMGEGQIQVNGRSYKGSMEVIEDKNATLTVINELSLEEYVMGVLAGETPRNWPLEALKAQAIAARTFAVLNRSQARQRGDSYDLEGTAFFQMYQGSDLVNDNIRKAVIQTRGDVLTYKSGLIQAFFHSNCGGRTARALDVWSKDMPYLRSVECSYGNNGPHYHWKAEFPVVDLVHKLQKAGVPLADVVRLQAAAWDESGRMAQVAIMDENGYERKMRGSVLRMTVGPDIIRSTRFEASVGQDKIHFAGKGWGHGVGLCQEGAYGMALKGFGAFDILRHYYHGVMVEKYKE